MTDTVSSYNLAVIHDLLTAAFSAEELRRFCQGHALFQPIIANFGPNHSLNQMADEVVDYCRTYHLWDELLEAIEEKNPRQYDRFRDSLRVSSSSVHSAPSPPVPSLPIIKGLVSRPVVWLVLAALILSGGYWLFVRGRSLRVALRTAHDKYVTAMGADRGWEIVAETRVIDDYEEFTLRCQDDGTIVLQTCHRTEEDNHRYVTAMGEDWDWVLLGETDVILDWEKFTFLDASTGEPRPCVEVIQSLKDEGEVSVAFQTWHEKDGNHRLVTAMGADWDWVLRAETNELKASEKFALVLLR
jgi:hypothetical protein